MTPQRPAGPTAEELREEHRRVRRAQLIVAIASHLLVQGRPARAEAEAIVQAARARILELFPGREETFDILYGRRFERLLNACAPLGAPAGPARILPFPARSLVKQN